MSRVDHLIIGGGIAGVSAAETVRSRDERGSILVVGDEKHLLYSRVLLPHVVRGKVSEEKVFLKSAALFDERRIGFATGVAVVSIEVAAHAAVLSDGSRVEYGKLLVATGGSARRLSCPGAEAAINFQTLDDARLLAASMSMSPAFVYGSGFIALEFIMSFAHHGVPIVSVMRGDGFFSRTLDQDSVSRIEDTLKKRGVEPKKRIEIKAIETDGTAKTVFLTDGASVRCATVGVGIGIEPNIGFLRGSGIETASGVLADGMLRSSSPDVFVAGDVAEFMDPLVGRRHVVGNWQNAMFQGRVAGENMTGGEKTFETITSYSISCFDLPMAFVGATDVATGDRVIRSTADGTLQLFFTGGRVVGATSVGPFQDRAAIMKLITGKIVFTPTMMRAAGDSHTNLATLIP